MYCPKCEKLTLCGCGSCKPRRKGMMPRLRTFKFTDNGELFKCPYCRKKSHPDEILDFEWELRNDKIKTEK